MTERLRKALLEGSIAIVLTAGILVAVAGWWFRNDVYLDASKPEADTSVVIPRGATFADVTHILEGRGVLAHALAFRLLARLRHDEGDVRAGEFMFPAHESADEVLRRLIEGGAQTARWITIPEGFTSKEIAAELAARGLGAADGFERVFSSERLVLDGTRTVNLEGYLFPDTYLVPVQTTPHAVAALLTGQFEKELPDDAARKAKALGFTVPQIVTVASLIEREAKADDERALMAGVYYNRMKRGMPLEVDATIEYIFPEHHTEITRADLRIDSPYNTYLYQGLPPTPIANPGRASIIAAFNPQPSDYLYYVYRGDGHHAFARTLAEHNANVERYLP